MANLNWYRPGAVSVASGGTAVTFATGALTIQARAGDLLFIDGFVPVEIGAILTATTLTLADPWPNASVTSGVAKIARTSQAWTEPGNLALDIAAYIDSIAAIRSLSTVTVGAGDKTFAIPVLRTVLLGAYIQIAPTAAPGTVLMTGYVTATSAGSITVTVDDAVGSGIFNSWNLVLSGRKGPTGVGIDGEDGAGYGGTSTTSLAVGAGSKTLTTQARLAYVVGSRIRLASSATPTTFMEGVVTAYSETTLTFTSDFVSGSGTLAAWTLSVAGESGIDGDPGASYAATSTTSLAIGTGSKTFTTQAGLAYVAGTRARAARAAAPSTFMEGIVTAYSGTSLTIAADRVGGSGTFTDWNLSVAGDPGAPGLGNGDVVGPTSAAVGNVAVYDAINGKQIADGGQSVAGIISAAAASAVATIRNSVAAAFDTLAEVAEALALKADAASPTFTGTPTAPTATAGTSTTQIATTEFASVAATAAAGVAVDAHVAASDPHTQYHTNGRGDARYPLKGAAQAYTAQQFFSIATLTDAATVTWDGTTQQVAKVTLGGNRAIAAIANAQEGAYYELTVVQDATGTRVPTWASSGAGSYDFGADGAPTLTTTAGRADILGFKAITIAGTLKLRFLGVRKGFS